MRTRATPQSPSIYGLREALVTSVREGELRVRPVGAKPREARLALRGYTPRVGDRVLVAPSETDETLYVLAQLFGSEEPAADESSVRTPSGASATVEGDALVVRDARGRVAVRFDSATGTATISAPEGDLELAAPKGRVRIEAAEDLELTAGRRAELRAGSGAQAPTVSVDAAGGASVRSASLSVESDRVEARVTEGRLVAERIGTVITEVAHAVGRWELRARELAERADAATRDVEGLLLTRAGRSRTVVREGLDLLAKRARLVSKQDTVVDGKRVLLG